MKNTISELFLSEYFFVRTILDRFITDPRGLFYGLGKIYLIKKAELDKLYPAVRSGEVENVDTEKDFMQYRRIKRYAYLTGAEIDDKYEEIINIKGEAILRAVKLRLKPEANTPQNVLYATLSAAADFGDVNALRVMGVLLCGGIFLEGNVAAGIKYLSKSADWNDVGSILALLRYSKETRGYNLSRLYLTVKDTPFLSLYTAAAQAYKGGGAEEIREVKLIQKAFNCSVIKRDTYDARFARIIYCRALGFREKEKAVFTASKELLSAVADLPLKLSDDAISAADISSALESTPVVRREERAKIVHYLGNTLRRARPSYRPLLISSDSEFLLNMYAGAIKRADGIRAERIDVADLTDYDLEPTQNNIFVRSVDEDRDNYCLMFLRGDIPERSINAVKNFLQSSKRARFHLNSPCVTIDLSGVLPVCFADVQNAKLLKPYCDVVGLAEITADEKKHAIRSIIESKSKIFRIPEITLCEEAYGLLQDYGIDEIEAVLDEAVRSCRDEDAASFTADKLAPFLAVGRKNTIGFGGADI